MSVNIEVWYFARLAEVTGLDRETISVADSADMRTIWQTLSTRYHFDLQENQLKAAVNHSFVAWDYPIKAGDIVAFIPPVAGG